jgi:transcriptional regulator of aromatic amino acid metabolism
MIDEMISLLISHFADKIARSKECSQKFSSAAINLLKEYDWTGNIRELRNGGAPDYPWRKNFENDVLFASK